MIYFIDYGLLRPEWQASRPIEQVSDLEETDRMLRTELVQFVILDFDWPPFLEFDRWAVVGPLR